MGMYRVFDVQKPNLKDKRLSSNGAECFDVIILMNVRSYRLADSHQLYTVDVDVGLFVYQQSMSKLSIWY